MGFSLITGIGHCGTKWLSTILNRPEQGVRCYHELSYPTTIGLWQDRQKAVRERGLARNVFPKYWRQIDGDLKRYKFVCDSMSWCSIESVAAAKVGNAEKIIYLVRNGIQQLYSAANCSIWLHVSDDHFLYQGFLKTYWEIAGKPYKEWSRWTRWEKLCLWWETNEFMPQWMTTRFDGVVETYRLEDLVTPTGRLEKIVSRYGLTIDGESLHKLQGNDVNRKVPGDRSPSALWEPWSEKEKEAFLAICTKGMQRYNYRIMNG